VTAPTQPTVSAFERIAEVALLLLLVLPFANPIHTSPIPSFYSEWLAALLALILIAATLGGSLANGKPLSVPGIVALPLLLGIAIAVQAGFGHVAHPRQALLFMSVLLLAGAMMVAGHSLAREGRFESVAPWLARFLVAGGLLQCAVLLLQRAGISVPWLVFLPAAGAVPTGSLGQANHLADYLWMGVASALYLMARAGRLTLTGCGLVLGLAMVSVLPASRSVLLYPLGLALVALLAWRASKGVALWRQLALLCCVTLPLMLIADQLNGKTSMSPTAGARTLVERLATSGGEPIRAGMYQVALEEALTSPLAGQGLGATPAIMFQRAERWPEGATPVVAEHVHNIVLQWLLEFGVPLTVSVLALLLYWLWCVLPTLDRTTPWWGLSLLTVIGIHSQLEYPLWLTYFLLPACWLMGALSQPRFVQIQLRTRHQVIAVAGSIAAGVIMTSLWLDYRQLEFASAASAPGNDPRSLRRGLDTAIVLERDSLFASQAIVLMVEAMGVSREGAGDKWALCQRALRISPTRDVAFKCTATAAIGGEGKEASNLLDRGLTMYGSSTSWQTLQAEFPELRSLEQRP
jgi:O-antigen ligase